MDWFAMNSKFYIDLDDQGVSEAAQTLLTRACGYMADNETSGYLAKSALKKLGLSRSSRRVDELVLARIMIERVDGSGYDFPAWLKWNEPLERLVKKRKADKTRVAEKRSEEQNVARQSREKNAMSHEHTNSNKDIPTKVGMSPPVEETRETAKTTPGRTSIDRLNNTSHSPDAFSIVTAYEQQIGKTLEPSMRIGIAKASDQCMQNNYSRNEIENGILEWEQSNSWSPTQIPNFVHKWAAKQRNPKMSKNDQKVAGWLHSAPNNTNPAGDNLELLRKEMGL